MGSAGHHFSDRWTLFAGGRYNKDDEEFTGRKGNAASVPTNFGRERSFSRFSGKLGLEWKATDGLFGYVTVSQGYKAGTYDPFAPAETIATGIDEETVDSLEFGLKAELFDRSLRLNSALFLTRYQDLAIGTITSTGLQLQNAGESEIKGLETELTWVATDRLRVFGSLALLDAQWRSLAAGALLTGVKLSDAPPFTYDLQASISAAYEIPLGTGSLTLTATGRHIDEYYQQVAHLNNPLDRVDARDWVDASVAWQSGDGQHRLVLAGKNLSDEQGQYSALNFSTFLFNNTAAWLPGEARTWELTYTYSLK